MSSNPPSAPDSRSATPGAATARFIAPQADAEDVLKSQTVGLVNPSDYRKRRAEAADQTSLLNSDISGASTPRDGTPQPSKKKAKKTGKGLLSFAADVDDGFASVGATPNISKSNTPVPEALEDGDAPRRRLGPNTTISNAPKAKTKSALLKEAQTREQLRKDFLVMQEAVKATEIVIPFVFYDGTNIPGGRVRVKKGDHIWLFLDKARKVGAEMGVGDSGRKGWARISVDDLMLVRGDIIIPPHHEFHYFIVNKTAGFSGPIFKFAAEPTAATPKQETDTEQAFDPLASRKKKENGSQIPDSELEGFDHDASITKVVDRRWYEKNKHIFPASLWEDFDVTKDYSQALRKDAAGNVLFSTPG